MQQRLPRDGRLRVRITYWLFIAGIIAACVGIRHADPGFIARLRLLGFDMLQQTLPRVPDAQYPVKIVDIDEASIRAFGTWPWRRDLLARLIDALSRAGVRVVVFDMVFPEATGGPLDHLPDELKNAPEIKSVLDRLAEAGAPDAAFAEATARHPTVLGIIGTGQVADGAVPPAKASFATIGANVERFVPSFPGASQNLPLLENAAASIGALNWLPDHDQILRRIPVVVALAGRLYPSLVTEALRVANGAKTLRVRSAGDGGFAGDRGITTIAIGDTVVPTDRDGQLWLHFTRHDPRRTVSAADVLQDKAPAADLQGRIAIIGTSAPGLLDLRATPLDPVISGVEINAQALEQLLANRLLIRPDYATGLEIVLTVGAALLLATMLYHWGARVSAIVGFATVCLFSLASLLAFANGLLLDAVFPIMTSSAAYVFGTGYLYYQTESERNRGREALERIAREMEAAAQIQRTFLPKERPTGPLESKFEIYAVMMPAKSIGGDFFDYFLIGDTKLGFAVGDVSGKGVPAALFMSVSRTVLRTVAFEGEDPGPVLSKVNGILARDNTEGMFVTIFYAVLDLETGRLSFSSAGHDDSLLLGGADGCEPLGYMGPAIGLFDDAEFPTATRDLAAGDTMLLLTDGITEAFNIDGRVFNQDRVRKAVTRRTFGRATDLVQSLVGEVTRFSEGTEQSDDITCVAMRFKG